MKSHIESYDLALKLKSRTSEQQLSLLKILFRERGFQIFDFKTRNSYVIFLKFNRLPQILKEAEKMRIQKVKMSEPEAKSTLLRNALSRNMDRNLDLVNPKIREYESFETITQKNLHKFINNCPEEIEDLDSISENLQESILNLFSSSELIRIKCSILKKLRLFDLNIVDFLNKQDLLIGIYPLYENEKLLNNMASYEKVFGEKVSIYFQFLKNYIKWLIFPAIVGFANIVSRHFLKQSSHLILADYAYSFFITMWFTIFLVFWQRKQSEINVKYGSYGKIFLVADKNPNFKAPEKINLITGLPQEYYPKYKRFFLYFISFLEAMPFLFLGLGIKMLFLTLKGLIIPGELFYFEAIGSLIKEGRPLYDFVKYRFIFDFLQIEATSKVNSIYRIICQISTNRENHRTNQSCENSYALKRFCFEFVNRFLHLGYIAYIKVDFSLLIRELTIIFVMDEVRRVVLESLIPLILKKISRRREENKIVAMEKKDLEIHPYITEKIMELDLPDYENFDDYLEIIIQFCYLTLFAGVFPQASFLSFFFNIIEYYSDSFKLTNKLYKRPIPSKANSIDCWIWLLNILSFVCVFSNTFLFAFQCHNYYYSLKVAANALNNNDQNNSEEIELTKSIWVNIFLIVFITEHAMMTLILITRYFIKSRPKWVRVFLKRQEKKNMRDRINNLETNL